MQYSAKADIEINGAVDINIQSVTEGEAAIAVIVKLMGGQGFAKVAPEETFIVNYVPPIVGERDWRNLDNFTCTLAYEGGKRVTYSQCQVQSVGELVTDGENAGTIPVACFPTGLSGQLRRVE